MIQRLRLPMLAIAVAFAFLMGNMPARAQTEVKGLRVFYSGHSFHYFVPPILADMAKTAGIKDHKQIGVSAIGGSRVYQHWNADVLKLTYFNGPDTSGKPLSGVPTKPGTYTVVAKLTNDVKDKLTAGQVDVFTMSPIYLPDDGIEKFVKLGLENNPKMRILVQENWLPWDHYDVNFKAPKEKVDHNAPTAESLRKLHEPYFKAFDEYAQELNKKYETKAVCVVPVGQAVIALREKILKGEAPGLKDQNDLFTDAIGHAKAPLAALCAYCYYASIYQRSPVGLPMPAVLGKSKGEESENLNRLLQEIAWQAVSTHPLSGVKGK